MGARTPRCSPGARHRIEQGSCTTSPRTVMVVEPPPSRLSASRAPSERIRRAASRSVMPVLQPGRRPSTVTGEYLAVRAHARERRGLLPPPRRVPCRRRGACWGAERRPCAATATRPPRNSRGPALTTSLCCASSSRGRPANFYDVSREYQPQLRGGAASRRKRAASPLPVSGGPSRGTGPLPGARAAATVPLRSTASTPPPLASATVVVGDDQDHWLASVHVSTALGRVVGTSPPPRPPACGNEAARALDPVDQPLHPVDHHGPAGERMGRTAAPSNHRRGAATVDRFAEQHAHQWRARRPGPRFGPK